MKLRNRLTSGILVAVMILSQAGTGTVSAESFQTQNVEVDDVLLNEMITDETETFADGEIAQGYPEENIDSENLDFVEDEQAFDLMEDQNPEISSEEMTENVFEWTEEDIIGETETEQDIIDYEEDRNEEDNSIDDEALFEENVTEEPLLYAATSYEENNYVNTGNYRTDLLNIAMTQRKNNYEKYAPAGEDWCAYFVSWCARQAEIPESVFPNFSGCTTARNLFLDRGMYHNKDPKAGPGYFDSDRIYHVTGPHYDVDTSYQPKPGDLALFSRDNSIGDCDHVSIVQEVFSDYIDCVGGNQGPGDRYTRTVCVSRYYYSDVVGYVDMSCGQDPISEPESRFVANIDKIEASNSSLYVQGWCFDKLDTPKSISCHIYDEDGTAIAGVPANMSGEDVNNAYGITGKHRFAASIPVSLTGTHNLLLYVVNDDQHEEIGWYPVTFPEKRFEASIDGVVAGCGTLHASGWCFDTQDFPKSIECHVYDGEYSPEKFVCSFKANQSGEDVNSVYGINGKHRFDGTVSVSLTGTHDLLFYAVNDYMNELIGRERVNFPSDVENPVISNLKYKEVGRNYFIVSCDVSDNGGISRVWLPTWNTSDQEGTQQNPIVTPQNGHVEYRFDISSFGNRTGKYITHVYAYDNAGNQTFDSLPGVQIDNRGLGYYNTKDNLDGRCYYLRTRVDDLDLLEAITAGAEGAGIMNQPYQENKNQLWKFISAGDGTYYIKSLGTPDNMYLDNHYGTGASGSEIVTHTYNGSDAQKWRVYDLEDGTCALMPKTSTECVVDLTGNSWIPGTGFLLSEFTNSPAQKFKLMEVTDCSLVGHKYSSEWTIDKEATCTKAGSKSHHCTVCGSIDPSSVTAIAAKGHSYTINWTVEQMPTCTQAGIRIVKCVYCSDEKEVPIEATGHNLKKIEKAEATCTQSGKSEYYMCLNDTTELFLDVQGKIPAEEEDLIIPATGHSYGDWVVTKEATCTQAGSRERVCGHCGEKQTQDIPAAGHRLTFTVEVQPTCEAAGRSGYYQCSACNQKFFDKDGQNPVTDENDLIIPASGHKWNNGTVTLQPTCMQEGTRVKTCINDPTHTKTETLAALGHSLETIEGKEATATEEGWRTYYRCTRCAKLFSDSEGKQETSLSEVMISRLDRQWVNPVETKKATCTEAGEMTYTASDDPSVTMTSAIPALGHSIQEVAASEATCTTDGTVKHYVCSRCAKLFSDQSCLHEIQEEDTIDPAKGHTYGNGTVTREATCMAFGLKTYTCSRCGHTKKEILPALGHDLQMQEGVPATCTSQGYESYYICSRCGGWFNMQKEPVEMEDILIPASGHSWEGVVTTEPTCVDKGLKTFTCKHNASHTYTEKIPATGHNLIKTDAVEATEDTEGNIEYWTCSNCGKFFSDANGSAEISQEDTVLLSGKQKEEKYGIRLDEEHFPDGNFRIFLSDYDTDSNGYLSQGERDLVTWLDCTQQGIRSLEGLKYFEKMIKLTCDKNPLEGLYLADNQALESVVCQDDGLTELDLTKNPGITFVNCCRNSLSVLDVTHNTGLTGLYCENNRLNELDVSKNPELKMLCFSGNNISTINLSNNPWIERLEFTGNKISSIDVSAMSELFILSAGENELVQIDVTHNPKLQYFRCENNKLTSLDVSKNVKLHTLGCYNNELAGVHVTTDQSNCTIQAGNNRRIIALAADGTFDLAALEGFDLSFVQTWNGAYVEGSKLIFDDPYNDVTYTYDIGNGKTETFTLVSALNQPETHVHQFSPWYTVKEATCSESGTQRRDCRRCDYYEEQPYENRMAHTLEIVEEVPATTVEEGVREHYRCSLCGKCFSSMNGIVGKEVSADALATPITEHVFDRGVVVREATKTEDGLVVYTCIYCGATEEKTIEHELVQNGGEGGNETGTDSETGGNGSGTGNPDSVDNTPSGSVPETDASKTGTEETQAPSANNDGKTGIVSTPKALDIITVSKKPGIKKPTSKKTKIIVKWKHFKHTSKKMKKVWNNIKKVQVQCSNSKSFASIVKTVSVKKASKQATIKGLKKNTTYYVRVRYFDGTGYSKWSKVKKIKTKK